MSANPRQELHKWVDLLSDEAKLLQSGTDRAITELVLEAIRLELGGKPLAELVLNQHGADFFRAAQKDRVAKIAGIFKIGGGN